MSALIAAAKPSLRAVQSPLVAMLQRSACSAPASKVRTCTMCSNNTESSRHSRTAALVRPLTVLQVLLAARTPLRSVWLASTVSRRQPVVVQATDLYGEDYAAAFPIP